MREVELTWEELQKILQEANETIFLGEEIREITLMKPKKLRIYLERK